MSDEAAFQAALDAAPDDHTARLVFADWLQERGDPRSEGYRALGLLRRVPSAFGVIYEHWFWACGRPPRGYGCRKHLLPRPWFALLPGPKSKADFHDDWPFSATQVITRKQAEDAAAGAFVKLSATQRRRILARATPGASRAPGRPMKNLKE